MIENVYFCHELFKRFDSPVQHSAEQSGRKRVMSKTGPALHGQYHTFKSHLFCWRLIAIWGRHDLFSNIVYSQVVSVCISRCPIVSQIDIQLCVVLSIHTQMMAACHQQGRLKQLFRLLWPTCNWHGGAPVWKLNREVHSLLFWLLGTRVKPINTHGQACTCHTCRGPDCMAWPYSRLPLWFPARSDSLTIFHSHLQPARTENNSLTRSPHLSVTSLSQWLMQSLALSSTLVCFMAVCFYSSPCLSPYWLGSGYLAKPIRAHCLSKSMASLTSMA